MTQSKDQYLAHIRANTAYPTYRGIIGLITMVGFGLAGITALSTLVSALGMMTDSFVAGLGVLIAGGLVSALIFLMARFWKEASLILADIGDSISDANSRTSQP